MEKIFEDEFEASTDNITIINVSTVLRGDINSINDLTIYGVIDGNVECESDLTIYGKVNGKISGRNILLDHAEVVGDVDCVEQLRISQDAHVEGNVTALSIETGGFIQGNIIIDSLAKFEANAMIVGDVQAQELEVHKGALIQGEIFMERHYEVE